MDEPTTWCSPAFFVPKADDKRVRLVTDFNALNRFVQRPTHPFLSTREIIEAIPPEAKLFCKPDAVHRYFQLALDERSSKLTTFLIQQGRFRYLCAPMGLNASSDEWCHQCHQKLELGNSIHIEGHCPDDDKLKALRDFWQARNVKELRSFLGLVAQFGALAPDIACLASHLRQLLQKEIPWVWLPEHKLDFENTKKVLTSPTMLQPFDRNVKTVVLAES